MLPLHIYLIFALKWNCCSLFYTSFSTTQTYSLFQMIIFIYLGKNTIIFILFFILILSWTTICQIVTGICRSLYCFLNLSRTTQVLSEVNLNSQIPTSTFSFPNTVSGEKTEKCSHSLSRLWFFDFYYLCNSLNWPYISNKSLVIVVSIPLLIQTTKF